MVVMALTKKQQAKEPSLIPTLDGEFDCIWFYRNGSKYQVQITRIKNEAEAKAFCEQKAVDKVIDKIRSWQSQQEFIRYQMSETDHLNIKPRLKTLGEAIDKLQRIAKDRTKLATILDEHVIGMIEVCRPGKKSKFRESTDNLIEDLKKYCSRILSKQ